MNDLNIDVLLLIYQFLDFDNIEHLYKVNKNIRSIVANLLDVKIKVKNCQEGILMTFKYKKCRLDLRVGKGAMTVDIDRLYNLKWLRLIYNNTVTDYDIQNLTLHTLVLTGPTRITDYGIRNMSKLHRLHLMNNISITDDGLSKLNGLKRLCLGNNRKITKKSLQKLKNLEELRLHGRSNNIFYDCIKSIPSLKKLVIYEIDRNLTDDQIIEMRNSGINVNLKYY